MSFLKEVSAFIPGFIWLIAFIQAVQALINFKTFAITTVICVAVGIILQFILNGLRALSKKGAEWLIAGLIALSAVAALVIFIAVKTNAHVAIGALMK